MRLTDKAIAGLTIPNGKSELLVFDDDLPGFGLRLRTGGSRKWIFQYRRNGRQHRMTLGSLTSMDAVRARNAAKKHHHEVGLGGDPAHDKAEAKTQAGLTFEKVVDDYLAFRERANGGRRKCARRGYTYCTMRSHCTLWNWGRSPER
jgi:hypothetical protein